MTKRDAFEVGLKIIGAYFMVQAIAGTGVYLAMILSNLFRHTNWREEWGLAWGLIWPAALLAAGWVLLFRGEWLARKLMREDAVLPEIGAIELGPQAFTFALKIVGVVALIKGMTYGVQAGITQVYYTDPNLPNMRNYSQVANAALYAVIGIYLLSGASQFVKWVYRERPSTGEES